MKRIGKIFLVLCMMIYQLSPSISVFAEVLENVETNLEEEIKDKENNENSDEIVDIDSNDEEIDKLNEGKNNDEDTDAVLFNNSNNNLGIGNEETGGEEGNQEILEDKFVISANGNEIGDDGNFGYYDLAQDEKTVVFSYDLDLVGDLNDVKVYIDNNDITDNTYSVDYDGMLYGDYEYKFVVKVNDEEYITKTIYIYYYNENEYNENVLTRSNDLGAVFTYSVMYLYKNGESITGTRLINSINLNNCDKYVVDSSDNEITDSEISNDDRLVVSNGKVILEYKIVLLDDAEVSLKTNVIDNVSIGDKVNVEFILNNINMSDVYNIHGIIEYDHDILSLDEFEGLTLSDYEEDGYKQYYYNSNSDNAEDYRYAYLYYNESTGEFYLYSNYMNGETLLKTVFTAESTSDDTTITFKDLKITYNDINLKNDYVSVNFAVTYTSNVGGDVEDTIVDSSNNDNNNSKPVAIFTNNEVKLSSNSLLDDLKIKGYDIEYNPSTYEYYVKVKNSVKSLDIEAILADNSASYVIKGNENFKVGENIVEVIVTAEDGSSSTYKIIVDREDKKETAEKVENQEKKNDGITKIIIVVLIVAVIGGLVYLIFKDDQE